MTKSKRSLKRIIKGGRNRIARYLFRGFLRLITRKAGTPLELLGTPPFGWSVPLDRLSPDSICYCAGVGENISFDLELIKRKACDVFAFDPTPRAARYVEKVAKDNIRFHFSEIGLWKEDGTMKFYEAVNPQLVNHSIVNIHGTTHYFSAPCQRLCSIMKDLGHTRIDLLKIDIEGAEHEVLHDIVEARIPIETLCVEFDQPAAVRTMLRSVRRLLKAGYRLVGLTEWDFTFIHRDLSQREAGAEAANPDDRPEIAEER